MEKYTELKNKRVSLKDAIPLPMPFALFIDPTNLCNFKCSFCPRNSEDFKHYAGSFTHMNFELFKKIIDEVNLFPNRLKALRLYYLGEPMLNPMFTSMLEYAMEQNVADRIEITSNGSLLTEEIAERIVDISLRYPNISLYMRFSIYSIHQEKNKKITKSDLSVDRIFNNIKRLKAVRDSKKSENVFLYAKMIDSFDDENKKFLELYNSVVDETYIEEPFNWSGYGEKNLLEEVYDKERILQLSNKEMPKACAYPFHTMAIQADGKVVCCCVDWSRHTLIGDCNTQTLQEIWNGKRLKQIQIMMLAGERNRNEACKNCEFLPAGKVHDLDDLDGVSPEVLLKGNNW